VRARLSIFAVTLAGCQGLIAEPSGEPSGPVDRLDGSVVVIPDVGPAPCEPEPTVVPKLLRLSNFEYRNIVSDLLGAPVDPALFARWTPVAEVYGFDTMSETRIDQQAFEEQLATAEALTQILLATPSFTAHCPALRPLETPVCASRAVYSSQDDFSDAQDRECWSYLDSSGTPMLFDNTRSLWRKEPDETALLWREGAHPGTSVDVVRRWVSPLSGTATVTVGFTDADPGGGDGITGSITVNGQPIWSQIVDNGGPPAVHAQYLALNLGDRVEFTIARNAGPEYDTTGFLATFAFAPTPRKVDWTWEACAEPLVTKLASRAFRRPLRAEEREHYRRMFLSISGAAKAAGFAEPADEALIGLVQAILLSPNLVFKPELVPGGNDPSEKSYAIASHLGLYFRSSLPDDSLWDLAARGGLASEEAIRTEALRLLRANLDTFSMHFGGQWLAYRDLGPGPLAEPMRKESLDVFATVLAEGLPPERLLRPGFTIVEPALADFYGLPAPPGATGRQRILTNERGGLVSQGGFLAKTGNGSEFRRPIHRGLWVLTRLLGQALPRLDRATREEIGMSLEHIDPTLPLFERMQMHRSSQTRCGSCHSRIDPIGLGLENYDPEGRWRDTYADGSPILASLELEGRTVTDPFALAEAIESSNSYRTSLGTKLLTFALNRGPLDPEQCVARRIGKPIDGTMPSLEQMTIDALIQGMALTEVSP
jgi:hypothetical protein